MNIREAEYQKERSRVSEETENQREKQRREKEEGQRGEQNVEQKRVIPRHEKLWVWQKSHSLMIEIFKLCKRIPRDEKYRLIDQIQRSSKSVVDNIAEGCSSYYFNNKIKSYFVSRKEAGETQSHIREMESKNYLRAENSQELIERYEEVIRGLNGLINKTCELRDLYGSKGVKRI